MPKYYFICRLNDVTISLAFQTLFLVPWCSSWTGIQAWRILCGEARWRWRSARRGRLGALYCERERPCLAPSRRTCPVAAASLELSVFPKHATSAALARQHVRWKPSVQHRDMREINWNFTRTSTRACSHCATYGTSVKTVSVGSGCGGEMRPLFHLEPVVSGSLWFPKPVYSTPWVRSLAGLCFCTYLGFFCLCRLYVSDQSSPTFICFSSSWFLFLSFIYISDHTFHHCVY